MGTPTSVLSSDELVALVERVFKPRPGDTAIAVLIDLPDAHTPDNPRWRARRELEAQWAQGLAAAADTTHLPARLVLYRNVRTNNGDLPEQAWLADPEKLPAAADDLDPAAALPLSQVLSDHTLLLAPTELSATAPLKLLGKRYGFRAATMPGFCAEMIPALRLDYTEINRRVQLLKGLLDRAEAAQVLFEVEGRGELALELDLRHRSAHASGGLLLDPGAAGNLPSGEAYVVPYEGEKAGDPSRTRGHLPVQFGDEVVVYRVEQNRAVAVEPGGEAAAREARRLAEEPAYGNLAELGLGVLADFGVPPSGVILLDEKLGLHIAFGRSDHFGGQVGAAQFSRPEAVVHIDRVYIRNLQPRIGVKRLELAFADGERRELLRQDRYVVDFAAPPPRA